MWIVNTFEFDDIACHQEPRQVALIKRREPAVEYDIVFEYHRHIEVLPHDALQRRHVRKITADFAIRQRAIRGSELEVAMNDATNQTHPLSRVDGGDPFIRNIEPAERPRDVLPPGSVPVQVNDECWYGGACCQ